MRKLNDKQNYDISFEGENVYIGIDVHLKQWHVCVRTSAISRRPFTQCPDAAVLRAYLDREFPGAAYYSAYESGFCGFSVHRELERRGIKNIVFNPADIRDTQKERLRKTDAVDCVKICRNLMSGDLTPIYVPDETVESHRELLNYRGRLIRLRTAVKNRLKGYVNKHGIKYPTELVSPNRHWSRAFLDWLETAAETGLCRTSARLVKDNIAELRHTNDLVREVDKEILSVLLGYYPEMDLALRSIPGIGRLCSAALCAYIVDINRFESDDRLAGYIGLVPDVRSSDEKAVVLGVTLRGNRMLRSMMIECAWRSIALDPALSMAYTNYIRRGLKPNNAIIRIARKLVNRIRYVLRAGNKYETRKLK